MSHCKYQTPVVLEGSKLMKLLIGTQTSDEEQKFCVIGFLRFQLMLILLITMKTLV
jgi:hypothetical protein